MGRSLLLCLVATMVSTSLFTQAPITVYVGPQTREGFVDVDQGVLDSIKDVQAEFRSMNGLRLAARAPDAQLVVTIVGRSIGGSAGAVAIPMGSTTIAAPIHGHVLEGTLAVGTYVKPLLAEDRDYGTWKRCATLLARDVAAWVAANRDKLPQR